MMQPIYSFVTGEISPLLYGREDLPAYQSSCKEMMNFYPLVHGAARRRPGMYYLNMVKHQNEMKARLIPFVFSQVQAYALEFGDRYIRFHHAGGTLMKGKVPYEVVTPYTEDQIWGINYCQSADILFLVHENYPPFTLKRTGEYEWQLEALSVISTHYPAKPDATVNSTETKLKPYEYAVTFMDKDGKESEISESVNVEAPYMLDYENSVVLSVNAAATPITGAYANIVNNVPHPGTGMAGPLREIYVKTITLRINGIVRPGTLQVFITDEQGNEKFTQEVKGTEWTDHGEGENPRLSVQISLNRNITIGTEQFIFKMESIYAPNYSIYADLLYHQQQAAVDDVAYAKIYRKINGIWAYVGRANFTGVIATFTDDGTYSPDITRTPPEYKSTFSAPGDYPGTVAFDNQRLIFGGSINKPNTIWGSAAGNYKNFATYQTPKASDPYEYTLASNQVNRIMWLLSSNKLLAGTTGSEWALSGDNGGGVSATSVLAKSQTAIGSNSLRALPMGAGGIFVNRTGKEVRSINYAYSVGGYDSASLSLFAEHMTRGRKIIDWAYAENPNAIVWCVLDDGSALALTYNQQHEVVAWSRHETDGFIESVTAVPGQGQDDVYFIVSRNGLRLVEMLMPEFTGRDTTEATYLDSMLSYHGVPVTRVMGLNHLNGKTVQIIADGAVHPEREVIYDNEIVIGGAFYVDLDYPASVIHIGLGYKSRIETHNLVHTPTGESASARKKRIDKVSVRFENTVGGSFHLKTDTRDEPEETLIFRKTGDKTDSAVPLFTGIKDTGSFGGYPQEVSLVIEQRQPLPMTVLGFYPRMTVTGS